MIPRSVYSIRPVILSLDLTLLLKETTSSISVYFRRRRYKVDNLNSRQKDNNSREGSLERSPMT